MFSFELLLDAIVLGLLVGCFYAAVSIGLSVSFGLLDVPHVAHPAFLVLAAYGTYVLNQLGIDPIIAGLMLTPVFFVFGILAYRLYYETFERRGSDAGVRGIAFFFGVAFVIEVVIILMFGVDQRTVQALYIGKSIDVGDMRIPMRLLVAFVVALTLTGLLTLYLARTFTGRAIRAVAQDEMALRLMGANPVAIKQWAFGIATAVLGLAGALLIIVSPVDPTLDRDLHRPHVLRGGDGGSRQHVGNAGRRHHPRRCGVDRPHALRRLVGAGHLVCDAARRPGRAPARPVREIGRNGRRSARMDILDRGGAVRRAPRRPRPS